MASPPHPAGLLKLPGEPLRVPAGVAAMRPSEKRHRAGRYRRRRHVIFHPARPRAAARPLPLAPRPRPRRSLPPYRPATSGPRRACGAALGRTSTFWRVDFRSVIAEAYEDRQGVGRRRPPWQITRSCSASAPTRARPSRSDRRTARTVAGPLWSRSKLGAALPATCRARGPARASPRPRPSPTMTAHDRLVEESANRLARYARTRGDAG